MTDDELIEWLLDWGRIGEEPVLIEAASRIKKLKAALREIASISQIICNSEDMTEALVLTLKSHRDRALKALDDAP